MNYVSFSLWSKQTIYNEGAIRNAEIIQDIYPGWKMVVYYDNTVPIDTIDKLNELDVLTIDITDKNLYGMFWRFLASDIDDCEYVVFRDCDSRVSIRERMAVDEWIESGKSIHVMRDHPAHAIPYGNDRPGILGGMWGIKSKILPLTDMILKWHESKPIGYGADQMFLKSVYEIYTNDMVIHDEFGNGRPFPIERDPEGRFIGERIDENDLPLTNDHIILKK